MEAIHNRIKIIPISKCLVHEGIVEDWAGQIATSIRNDGFMKNPVIVAKHDGYYVVLDGMHRFRAIKKLGINDILAYEVDYFSKEVILEGWDIFSFTKIGAEGFLKDVFPANKGYQILKLKNLAEARDKVLKQSILLAVGDKASKACTVLGLTKKDVAKKDLLDVLCEAVDRLDRKLAKGLNKTIYVDNSLTLASFSESSARSLVLRPQFTKQEVLDRTLHKKIFPPKSTRHLIPARPLRVDLDLSLLRGSISLKAKNKLLQDHLQWCHENNRVRFYPESIFIFAD